MKYNKYTLTSFTNPNERTHQFIYYPRYLKNPT